MAITVTNKTYGFATSSAETISEATTLMTVPAGANFMLKTIKAVDIGGSGGEIFLKAGSYFFEDVTVGATDNIDCSPLSPYAFEGGTVLSWQNVGGADIHVTITGILQDVSS
ncbi:MAG: hypothetical protein WCR17_04570 [Candidatus Methanomethylophilaceae archaeon]